MILNNFTPVKWRNKIFKNHSTKEFEDLAFEVFRHQLKHCEVYSDYASALGRTNPRSLAELPYLPISFFKSRQIHSNQLNDVEAVFKSSGTQGIRSVHYVSDF